MKQSYFLRSL